VVRSLPVITRDDHIEPIADAGDAVWQISNGFTLISKPRFVPSAVLDQTESIPPDVCAPHPGHTGGLKKYQQPVPETEPVNGPEQPGIVRHASSRKGSYAAIWQHQELIAGGYTVVPTVFLRNYAAMTPPLTDGELVFVLELMAYKWNAQPPYPSYAAVARHMGRTSDKMLRRYARNLQEKGYLKRERRSGSTTRFRLNGLFDALKAIQATKSARRGV
jgi:hypothetical protein